MKNPLGKHLGKAAGTFLAYMRDAKEFFVTSFIRVIHLFTNRIIFVLLALYSCSLASASFAFRSNVYLSVWNKSITTMFEVKDERFKQFTLQSRPKLIGTNEYPDLSSHLRKVRNNTYGHMLFVSPSNNLSSIITGRVTLAKYDIQSAIEPGVIDFFDYNDESSNSEMFKACNLQRFFNGFDQLSTTGYPFDGKDSSSFISSNLADSLINYSKSDDLVDYESLLGQELVYEIGKTSYRFSINNIYSSSSYYGPNVTNQFSEPIITNCQRLYESFPISIYASLCKDEIALREFVYQFANLDEYGFSFGSYFLMADWNPLFDDQKIPQLIGTLKSSNIYTNGTDMVASGFWITSLLLLILASSYAGLISKYIDHKDMILAPLIVFLLAGLITTIASAAMASLYASFSIFNFVYGCSLTFIPFMCSGIIFLSFKISSKKGK